MSEPDVLRATNSAFEIDVSVRGRHVHLRLHDLDAGFDFADGAYLYRAVCPADHGSITYDRLIGPKVQVDGDTVTIRGVLAGLELEHRLRLPADRGWLEERVSIENTTAAAISLDRFDAGMQRLIAGETGVPVDDLATDRFVAVPFRHGPNDPPDWDNEFTTADLLKLSGQELRVAREISHWQAFGTVPSPARFSEGWAWSRGEHTLGIFKFNQEAMEYSGLAVETDDDGVWLRFAGVAPRGPEPSSLRNIAPGQRIDMGVTRLVSLNGRAEAASYAFRELLDENGCRFPADYDPPVHWNELYDNLEFSVGTPGTPPGPRETRKVLYTRDLLIEEAAKARDYRCEALYLDPGWDTEFGTFLWGEEWMGDRKSFINEVREEYGLGTSLHCPVAYWTSQGVGVHAWPRAAFRRREDGAVVEGSLCMGARQYLDEAESRLAAHCADGVGFIMFDGTTWTGECWDPDHGHRVPYGLEDHCRANLALAQRVHARHPRVLIEMHDMVSSGGPTRYTPVYYKYGLPSSYDENWGFELMLQPLEDIRSGGNGRARALYYYSLACNVPLYTHIDLRGDNEHALGLWWFASTCRHLGIGGAHDNPHIASQHRHAMKRYRELERFYKRGDFYGLGEEVHVHAIPDENAFVVNLFNLSDTPRLVGGDVDVGAMGLDPDRWYFSAYHIPGVEGWSHGSGEMEFDATAGTISLVRRLPPESAEVVEFRSIAPS